MHGWVDSPVWSRSAPYRHPKALLTLVDVTFLLNHRLCCTAATAAAGVAVTVKVLAHREQARGNLSADLMPGLLDISMRH